MLTIERWLVGVEGRGRGHNQVVRGGGQRDALRGYEEQPLVRHLGVAGGGEGEGGGTSSSNLREKSIINNVLLLKMYYII